MSILFTNNAATTLASGITNVATSLTVAAGKGALFPTISGSDFFYATLANGSGGVEIVKVTARSTDTFTIVRGQDGTSGVAWNTGDKVELRVTAAAMGAMAQTANNLSDLASASTARTNLGLGTIATQAASSVSITGGSITGITDLTVADGGTGASTLTSGGYLKGAGTSAITSQTGIPAGDITSGTVGTARLGSGTANSSTYLRGDSTWATVSGGVTSAVAGNGIAVSAATGAVTFSAAAPTADSVGSYVFGMYYKNSGGSITFTFGTNYAGGGGNSSWAAGVLDGGVNAGQTTLSGTWKYLGATYTLGAFTTANAILCRVS